MLKVPLQLERRTLLRSLAYLTGAAVLPTCAFSYATQPSPDLPARAEGELDIHHIDTGRGNCTLVIAPDGTSFMIDAGAAYAPEETSGQPRPNATRRPGEWQALYAKQHAGLNHLDYMIATHIHPDHVGDLNATNPSAPSGSFHLTGVSDVDHLLPVTTHIDRGYPGFGDTPPLDAPFAKNYIAYLNQRVATGRAVSRAVVGSDHQIQVPQSTCFPDFSVRILSANGQVWTGESDHAERRLPRFTSNTPPSDQATENILSIALRLTYGPFSYFSGGDLNNDTHDDAQPWRDIETPVVRAAGRTEVAVADHHGYFDACGPEFVHRLDAQVYILQSWDVGHPGSAQVQRMLGAWDRPAIRDVFATSIEPANALTNRRFIPQLKSRQGHVVVRVAPGGTSYRIFILDSTQQEGKVTAAFGPYHCRTQVSASAQGAA